MRSPLNYNLTRGEIESGGAAGLETDIMRFMAILALCLVAIFALVQSLPLAPLPEPPAAAVAPSTEAPAVAVAKAAPAEEASEPAPPAVPAPPPDAAPPPLPPPAHAAVPAERGFTLRFESDLALTRLVASGEVGLYALSQARARRLSVRDSRLSFWDASAPSEFHEMEGATVPRPVVDALKRAGVNSTVQWGVTLPMTMRRELESLTRSVDGGALVIAADGSLRLETS